MTKKWTLTDSGLQVREGAKHIATVHYAGNPSVDINEAKENAALIVSAPQQASRIASLEADKSKLIAALEKIASGEGVYGKQAFEYKEIARAVLAEVQRD